MCAVLSEHTLPAPSSFHPIQQALNACGIVLTGQQPAVAAVAVANNGLQVKQDPSEPQQDVQQPAPAAEQAAAAEQEVQPLVAGHAAAAAEQPLAPAAGEQLPPAGETRQLRDPSLQPISGSIGHRRGRGGGQPGLADAEPARPKRTVRRPARRFDDDFEAAEADSDEVRPPGWLGGECLWLACSPWLLCFCLLLLQVPSSC